MLIKMSTLITLYVVVVALAAIFCNFFPAASKNRYLKPLTVSENKVFILQLIIIFFSLYLNLILTIQSPIGDSGAFDDILDGLTNRPLLGYYSHGGINYPPLFNYLFIIVGHLMKLFGVPFASGSPKFVFAMKIPGIICEFLVAFLLYNITKKKYGYLQTIPVMLLTLLNPGTLFITAYISQVDAIYSSCMMLTLYLISEDKLKASYFAFAASIMLKFQAIFITPVIFYATIKKVFLKDFEWKKFWTHLLSGLTAILLMFLSYIPFVFDFSKMSFTQGGVTGNFTDSIQSFGWTSQNTFNFWCLIGYNFHPEDEYFGPFTCTKWGTIFIVAIVIISIVLFIIRRNDSDMSAMPLLAAFMVTGTLTFAVRMMPRYLYPAVLLLILAFIIKPTVKRFIAALGICFGLFMELLFDYIVYPRYVFNDSLIIPKLLSAYLVAFFFYLIYLIISERNEAKN